MSEHLYVTISRNDWNWWRPRWYVAVRTENNVAKTNYTWTKLGAKASACLMAMELNRDLDCEPRQVESYTLERRKAKA